MNTLFLEDDEHNLDRLVLSNRHERTYKDDDFVLIVPLNDNSIDYHAHVFGLSKEDISFLKKSWMDSFFLYRTDDSLFTGIVDYGIQLKPYSWLYYYGKDEYALRQCWYGEYLCRDILLSSDPDLKRIIGLVGKHFKRLFEENGADENLRFALFYSGNIEGIKLGPEEAIIVLMHYILVKDFQEAAAIVKEYLGDYEVTSKGVRLLFDYDSVADFFEESKFVSNFLHHGYDSYVDLDIEEAYNLIKDEPEVLDFIRKKLEGRVIHFEDEPKPVTLTKKLLRSTSDYELLEWVREEFEDIGKAIQRIAETAYSWSSEEEISAKIFEELESIGSEVRYVNDGVSILVPWGNLMDLYVYNRHATSLEELVYSYYTENPLTLNLDHIPSRISKSSIKAAIEYEL